MRAILADIEQLLATAPALDGDSRRHARRESRLLVAAVLALPTSEIARMAAMPATHEPALSDAQRESILVAAMRRSRGEPLAYAVGTAAFRFLTLKVDRRVLIPRPETEIVVDEALRTSQAFPGGIAVDIGTGSGAIALSLATEGAFALVIATDISTDALAVAAENAADVKPTTPVEFRQGADLTPLKGVRAHVIVSNPPYIAYDEAPDLPSSVRDWEPTTALFASDGGMARYAAMLAGAASYLVPRGALVLEVDARRGQATADMAVRLGWTEVQLRQDLSGRDRVLIARNPA